MSISIAPPNTGVVPPWLIQAAPMAMPPRNPGIVPPSHQTGFHILPVSDTQFDPTPAGDEPIYHTLPVLD